VLTPDERQRIQYVLRTEAAAHSNAMVHDDLSALADKLEAEPEAQQMVLVSPLLKRAIVLLKAARGEGLTHELHDQIAGFLDGSDHEYPLAGAEEAEPVGWPSDEQVRVVANGIWPLEDLSSGQAREELLRDVREGLRLIAAPEPVAVSVEPLTAFTARVCPDCGEQIHEPDDAGRWGHYHEPPVGWNDAEDPWFGAVPVSVFSERDMRAAQQRAEKAEAAIDAALSTTWVPGEPDHDAPFGWGTDEDTLFSDRLEALAALQPHWQAWGDGAWDQAGRSEEALDKAREESAARGEALRDLLDALEDVARPLPLSVAVSVSSALALLEAAGPLPRRFSEDEVRPLWEAAAAGADLVGNDPPAYLVEAVHAFPAPDSWSQA
jgi:hypothetical protein